MFWLGVKATILFVMIFFLTWCQSWFFEQAGTTKMLYTPEDKENTAVGRYLGSLVQLGVIIDVALFVHHINLYVNWGH